MFITDLIEEPFTGITVLYGPAASGKTTVALGAAANSVGAGEGKVIYLSSGSNFSVDRLQALTDTSDAVLSKLVLFPLDDTLGFERAVQQAVKLSSLASLIVIDSLASPFRQLDRKSANLSLHRTLGALAAASCPVLIITDVYDHAVSEESASHEIRMVGGDMLRLSARTIIEMRDGVATVRKHPLHTGRAWQYRIVARGLEKI